MLPNTGTGLLAVVDLVEAGDGDASAAVRFVVVEVLGQVPQQPKRS